MEIGIHIIRQDMKKLFKPQIRTKNHSANDLRSRGAGIGEFSMRSIVRFGSRTTTAEAFPMWHDKRPIVEINTPEAIENSRNKLRMKDCFLEREIPQSDWFIWKESDVFINKQTEEEISIEDLLNTVPSGIVMKKVCGFKGHGMFYIQNLEDWAAFKQQAKNLYPNLDL